MSAIDFHTHAFPDEIARRAMAKLEAASGDWKARGSGTIKGLLASMDKADIDVSVLCTIATKPDQAKGILDWCDAIRSDRVEPFPSIHPHTPDPLNWLEKFAEAGYAGIKLHPMYQDFAIDDPAMFVVYGACCELGLAVAFHCGLDIAFADTDDRAEPRRVRNVIDRFPDLKLIATHMGGWHQWDLSRELIVGTPVYLETSLSLTELGPVAADMIRAHGTDRVLLGSDWPWATQQENIAILKSLGLNEADLRKILWTNAAKLLRY
ncbi:MAG: amidohydrolase family protein [Phycisphaerae bacterium]|nr:amidohydrolase family protein [Phycisphaerae bacterium]